MQKKVRGVNVRNVRYTLLTLCEMNGFVIQSYWISLCDHRDGIFTTVFKKSPFVSYAKDNGKVSFSMKLVTGEGKVFCVHAMTAYRGTGGKTQLILNHDTRNR